MKRLVKSVKDVCAEHPQLVMESVVVGVALFAIIYAAFWVASALGLH